MDPHFFMLYWDALGMPWNTIWDTNMGPRYGTPIWDPDLGPPIWDANFKMVLVCPPATSEAGARRPRSSANYSDSSTKL
jgi:hypothetical protein